MVEELQSMLDDHLVKTAAMRSTPAAAVFAERLSAWAAALAGVQDTLDAWLQVQVTSSYRPYC